MAIGRFLHICQMTNHFSKWSTAMAMHQRVCPVSFADILASLHELCGFPHTAYLVVLLDGHRHIVLCRLVVRVHCKPHCTKQYSVVQCRVFPPQSMLFPIVWCVVYIHFAACSLTTNLQSTINNSLWPPNLIRWPTKS